MPERLISLIERMARIVQTNAHYEGLKPTQWEALRYLHKANRFSRTPGTVTSFLGMTKGTVSQSLQALERKGLIKKQALANDRRAISLMITEQGVKALDDDPLQHIEQALQALTSAEQNTLTKGLDKLLQDLLLRQGGKPFGVCKTCRHFNIQHPAGAPHFCALLKAPLSKGDSEQICAEQEAA